MWLHNIEAIMTTIVIEKHKLSYPIEKFNLFLVQTNYELKAVNEDLNEENVNDPKNKNVNIENTGHKRATH